MGLPSEQSAIGNRQSAMPAVPAGFLSAPVAAGALGCAVRTVHLRCARGELRGVQAGGRGEWWVDPASDPALRLAVGDTSPVAAIVGTALAGLSAAQRERAFGRYNMVRRHLAAREHRPSDMTLLEFDARWVDCWNAREDRDGPRTSTRSLQQWARAYHAGGVAALVDRRGGGAKSAPFTPEAREFIMGMYLKQSGHGVPFLYRLLEAEARQQGWRIPSLRTVARELQRRADPKLIAAGRDPRAFRDRFTGYVRRDWTAVPAMDCWVADHRMLDVWLPFRRVVDRNRREVVEWSWRRPWLTCWLDARSWYPVGWIIDFEQPNAHRVASAFVSAVEAHGSPNHAILDNGKDFRAHEVAGGRSRRGRQKLFDERHTTPLLEALGVTVHWAMPYNAKAKVIEPWFGLVSRWFDRCFATYCGNNTLSIPERLRTLKPGDVARDYDLGMLRRSFRDWVERDYGLAASPAAAARDAATQEKLSPLRAFRELRPAGYEAVRPPAQDLAMLLTRGKRIRIEQNGVWVNAFGDFYRSDSPEYERRRAASGRDISRHVVYRFSELDPTKVWVFDATSDRFLFVATPVGTHHPLAAPGGSDMAVLADELGRIRGDAKRYTSAAAGLSRAAGNVLLAAGRRAGEQLGYLDDPASIAAPRPPRIRMVDAEITRAAQAGTEHDRRTAAARRQHDALLALPATGTDDEPARQPAVDALTFLARCEDQSVGRASRPSGEPRDRRDACPTEAQETGHDCLGKDTDEPEGRDAPAGRDAS